NANQYVVSVIDENMCRDSIAVELFQPEELKVFITSESDSINTIRLGESLVLGSRFSPVDGIMSWAWEPTDRVDCPDCAEVNSMPVINTIFILTGTDQDGCVATDELQVNVIPIRDLGVPNVVVPGQGDQNSYVTVYGGRHISR